MARGETPLVEGPEIHVTGGAVATEPADAARAGAGILAAGGNAMDAAAAACLACGVREPEAADVGGYVLCAVVLEASSGKIWSLDANSVAPAGARDGMYTIEPLLPGAAGINANEYACGVKDDANVHGPLAVGVPVVLGGNGTLWEHWGRLKWPQIVAPSLALLDRGFPFGKTAAAITRTAKAIRKFEHTARDLMPEGRIPQPQDAFRRDDLRKTLERLAGAGWRDFYEGQIGRSIADYITASGGILRRKDMSAFRPRIMPALSTRYRGAEVYAANLPNGGLSVLQMLNMLEGFETPPMSEPAYWHRLAEVLKLAWRDRLAHFGDPEHSRVDVKRILSKDYAAQLTGKLRKSPDFVDRSSAGPAKPSPGTIHMSAVDAEGNMVAATISHGGLFGSCVTVPGTGIILGHGMCRFDPRPGHPNSVGSRKRPLNNVCPTIIRMPDRDIALGLRGGRRIVSVALGFAQRTIDFGLTPAQTVASPRMHVELAEPVEVFKSFDAGIAQRLRTMGHEIKPVAEIGGAAHIVERAKRGGSVRTGANTWSAGINLKGA